MYINVLCSWLMVTHLTLCNHEVIHLTLFAFQRKTLLTIKCCERFKRLLLGMSRYQQMWEKCLKTRSHGAIFLFATAMQKMDCVDVNEGVHIVQFHVRAMYWCVRCHTWLGSTPILCNCDVRFQCKFIGNRIQTLRTLWTKSLNRKQHSISWYNKSQSHIAPCEQAFSVPTTGECETFKLISFECPDHFWMSTTQPTPIYSLRPIMNVFILIVSKASAEDQLIHWKH